MAMFVTLAVGIPVASGDRDPEVPPLRPRPGRSARPWSVGPMALFIALVYAVIVGLGTQLFDSSARVVRRGRRPRALAFQPRPRPRAEAGGSARVRQAGDAVRGPGRLLRPHGRGVRGGRRAPSDGAGARGGDRAPRSRSSGSASATSSHAVPPCSRADSDDRRRLRRTTPSTSSTRASASARSPSPMPASDPMDPATPPARGRPRGAGGPRPAERPSDRRAPRVPSNDSVGRAGRGAPQGSNGTSTTAPSNNWWRSRSS